MNDKRETKELNVLDDCRELYFAFSDAYIENTPLHNHIIRTIVSIGSNIAEGNQRQSGKEFIRFLNISLGSIAELEFQLSLLKYDLNINQLVEMMNKIRAKVLNLRKSIVNRSSLIVEVKDESA